MHCMFGTTQYKYLVPTIHSTIVVYAYQIAKKSASNILLITPEKITAATAKIIGILLKAASNVTWAPRAALFAVFRRSSEQVSKMLKLRDSCRKQLLLLSLN